MSTLPNSRNAVRAAEIAVLDVFLHEFVEGDKQVSLLEAGLRDARETMKDGKALWLATLGYLIVLEVIGQNVARSSTAFRDRGGSEKCFMAGAQEFAARTISAKDARALYGLRCAFAHEYGLRSANRKVRHIFEVSDAGALVDHPGVDWSQAHDPATGKDEWLGPTKANLTKVNVREVGVFVEELVQNVRAEHRAANVYLAPGKDALQLRNFGQFLIS